MDAKKKMNCRANGSTGRRAITGAGWYFAHGNPLAMPMRTMSPAWTPSSKTSCRSHAVKLPVTDCGARRRSSMGKNSSLVVTTQ